MDWGRHSWGLAPAREAVRPVLVAVAVVEGAAHSEEEGGMALAEGVPAGLVRHTASSAPAVGG